MLELLWLLKNDGHPLRSCVQVVVLWLIEEGNSTVGHDRCWWGGQEGRSHKLVDYCGSSCNDRRPGLTVFNRGNTTEELWSPALIFISSNTLLQAPTMKTHSWMVNKYLIHDHKIMMHSVPGETDTENKVPWATHIIRHYYSLLSYNDHSPPSFKP